MKCLKSIEGQITNYCFEVIIVLSGSSKNKQIFSYCSKLSNIKIITENKNNYCLKRNIGLQNSNGNYIAYIDDDAKACSDWVNSICLNFKDEWKMAGGQIEPNFEIDFPKIMKNFDSLIGGYNYCNENDYLSKTIIGCNMFFKKDWLLENGGFDEEIGLLNMGKKRKLWGGDEVAIARILENSELGYIAQAKVTHLIQKERLNIKFLILRALANGRAKKYHDIKSNTKTFGFKIMMLSIIRECLHEKRFFFIFIYIFRLIGYYTMKKSVVK